MVTQRRFRRERALLHTSFVGIVALNLGISLKIPVLELTGGVLLLPLVAIFVFIPIFILAFAAHSAITFFRS